MTRTHHQLSLEIIYEVTNSTLTLGASLSLVAWGFSDSNAVPNVDSYAGEHRQRCPAPGGDDHIGGRKPTYLYQFSPIGRQAGLASCGAPAIITAR